MKISSLQKGLVGHWTMAQDSLKGSLLADKTPYENDGTIYGATFTTDRKGKANSAMSFDGVNDYINCGNGASLNITDKITISAWVKPVGPHEDGYGGIWHDGAGSTRNRILLANDGALLAQYIIGGVYASCQTSSGVIPLNTWKQVIFTYNGSEIAFFVDGVKKSSTLANGGISPSSGNRQIGWGHGETYHFNGLIDDVRIYNRALSETEIKTLYNSYNPKIVMKTSLPKIKLYGGD
jgi:hypothetical protein